MLSRDNIKSLVIRAAGAKHTLENLTFSDDLFEHGYNSIAIVNLIELLEIEYGVFLAPEKSIKKLNTIDNIYRIIVETKATPPGAHFF